MIGLFGAVHKVRHAIFGQFCPPSPVTLCHTSRDPPQKYVTHLGLPRCLLGLVQKTRTRVLCTNSLSIVRGGFCLGAFVRGDFCPYLFLSEYICYNRKLEITLNFMFRMYNKFFYKRDVTYS